MVGAKIMLLLKPVLCSSCFLIITEIELKRKHFFESNISLENAFTYTLSLHKTTKARGNMNENRHKIPSYTKHMLTNTYKHPHLISHTLIVSTAAKTKVNWSSNALCSSPTQNSTKVLHSTVHYYHKTNNISLP